MPRSPNFAYSASPVEEIGSSLARALFGDPEAAAKQRHQVAQAEALAAQTRQADAHAGLYDSQTAGQTFQNTSAQSFGDLIRQMSDPQPVAPVVMPSDPLAPLPEAPAPVDPMQALRGGMPGLIAAIMGAQGDKVNMGDSVNALSAFLGNDEFARRGMVAQGATPGKDFALTPDRADDIAQTGYDEDYRKATGVATINNRDDIPVANIQANTSMRNQDVRSGDSRYGVDVRSGDTRRGQDIAERTRQTRLRAGRNAQALRPISASVHQMLFGVLDDPDELGELGDQLKLRGWDQTPDAGTMTRIRAAVIDRYRQTGNHVQAVREVLDEVKRRWDLKQAGMGG